MKKLLIILSMTALLTHCTKFDGFDPTTATVRWIIKQNLDVKRTSVHTTPSASPCTATEEAETNVEVWSLCPRVDVHGKHEG